MAEETFADNLKKLPSVDNIERIDLYRQGATEDDWEPMGFIENKEGKRGSLAVYADLVDYANTVGNENILHSAEGLQGMGLFSEHTEDARNNPGKHPNIDRLIDVFDGRYVMKVEIKYKG